MDHNTVLALWIVIGQVLGSALGAVVAYLVWGRDR